MDSIDQTTLIAIGAAIAIIILLTIVFGLARRRQSLRREQPPQVEARRDPFPATRERPLYEGGHAPARSGAGAGPVAAARGGERGAAGG
jgi:hypothetical protein